MGHSRRVAELLKEQLNADVEELQMVNPYPVNGKPRYLKFGFQAMVGFKPNLKPLNVNPSDYELVIIGSPTWNWRITPPVLSYITKNTFKNKNIALCLSAGGDGVKAMSRFLSNLQDANIISTFIARDSEASILPDRIAKWVEELKSKFN